MYEVVNVVNTRSLVVEALVQIGKEAEEIEENIMLGLQIADIFQNMDEMEYANYCYEKIKKLVPESQVHSHQLRNLLVKVYNLTEINEEEEVSISCDEEEEDQGVNDS